MKNSSSAQFPICDNFRTEAPQNLQTQFFQILRGRAICIALKFPVQMFSGNPDFPGNGENGWIFQDIPSGNSTKFCDIVAGLLRREHIQKAKNEGHSDISGQNRTGQLRDKLSKSVDMGGKVV